MSSISQRYMTQHFVSLNKFDTSIERVMTGLWATLKPHTSQRMFPALIGIEVDYNGFKDSVPVLRSFLRKFRTISQKHFVRFVTDTLWAMESDNGDVFYTHDGIKDSWCDAMWTLKIVNEDQIEIHAVNSVNTCRYKFLSELSDAVKRFIPLASHKRELIDIQRLIAGFYKNTKCMETVRHLQENLHVVFISNQTNTGFYPLILYGMSYFDAARKGVQISREMDYHYHTNYEIMTDNINDCNLMYRLIDMIQGTEKFGINRRDVADTYALTESLFGLFTMTEDFTKTRHDIMLINQSSRVDLETYLYSMDDISAFI